MIDGRSIHGGVRRAPWLFPRLLAVEDGALREPRPAEHHGFGRRRRIDTHPTLLLYVAWARDVVGGTQREVAQALYGSERTHLGASEVKRIRDAERDGRRLYRDLGVLPWAAYTDGRPAKAWWADAAFQAAMRQWQAQAVAEPSEEPAPDPDRARQETWDRTGRAIASRAGTANLARRIHELLDHHIDSVRLNVERESVTTTTLRSAGVEPWSFPGSDGANER